jgi:hypothetical protein
VNLGTVSLGAIILSTRPFQWLGIIGAAGLLAGAVLNPERIWANLLLAGVYILGLGLGGLYFVAIHYAAGAGWATAFRRIPEAMMGLIPVGSVLVALAVFGGRDSLYPWMAEEGMFQGFKGVWLNPGFFYLRTVLYLMIFCGFAWAIDRNSRSQDDGGNQGLTGRNRGISAAFLLLGSVTLTLAAIDWIKSLEPHWFSTMWGVYQFSGLFVAGLAAILLLAGWIERAGRQLLNSNHLHDLAKLLFAMSTFWMYIWFSQAMLIWYANVSEEAIHYTDRLNSGWAPMMVAVVLLRWVVPFFALMSQGAKKNFTVVRRVAAVALVGHAADLMVQIHPPVTGAAPAVAWGEVGALLVVVSALFVVVGRRLSKGELTPVGDPYLKESFHYHS